MKIIYEGEEPPSENFLPLFQYIPATSENKFFYQNGLAKVIPKLRVKVHTQLEECYFLWEKFSAKQSLFDLWDFRYAWYLGYGYQLYFYTLYFDYKPVGVLPLWYNSTNKIYEWFGGYWPEDNRFFLSDERYFPLLLKIAPTPIALPAILPEFLPKTDYHLPLIEDELKYILPLANFSSFEELVNSFSKKHRYNLNYQFNKIANYQPKIIFFSSYDKNLLLMLKDLSIQRFNGTKKDLSKFAEEKRLKTFEFIYKNQGLYKIFTLTVKIQDFFGVIDIIAIYKDNYYLLTGANDTARFPGIGAFVTYIEFEDAMKRKVKLIDVLQEDNNWKHRYFIPKRMLKFEKK